MAPLDPKHHALKRESVQDIRKPEHWVQALKLEILFNADRKFALIQQPFASQLNGQFAQSESSLSQNSVRVLSNSLSIVFSRTESWIVISLFKFIFYLFSAENIGKIS